MAQNLAGAAFSYTPGQLRNVFGPGRFTIDTTDRFGLGSLGAPSTKSNRALDALTQLKQSAIDPNSFAGFAFMQRYGAPTTAEELEVLMPFYEKLDKSRSETANKNAERKFGQEMLAAGLGALQRGIQTSIAGGSPEMIAYLADAQIRNTDAFLNARRGQPRQEIPVFSPQLLPNRDYYA